MNNPILRERNNLKQVLALFKSRTLGLEKCSDTLNSVLDEVANRNYSLFAIAVRYGNFDKEMIERCLEIEIDRLNAILRDLNYDPSA